MSEQDTGAAKAAARKTDMAPGMVKCRVLPLGHDEVHTGETEIVDGKVRAETFNRGDHFIVPKAIGVAQERAGRVEIVEGL